MCVRVGRVDTTADGCGMAEAGSEGVITGRRVRTGMSCPAWTGPASLGDP